MGQRKGNGLFELVENQKGFRLKKWLENNQLVEIVRSMIEIKDKKETLK